MTDDARLANAATVFVSTDLKRTAEYYRDVFGFDVVAHYEAIEPFVALYRDAVEIIVAQAARGTVEPNKARYGAAYDIYVAPEKLDDVDSLYRELKGKGARIVSEPGMADYGCYEFVIEDVDGRLVGIGHISDEGAFFGREAAR